MRTLNLGIVAHVDAGKTSLTERLLYAAGVLDEIGSVDDGSTLTDSLDLERQRGITIKSAVASFTVGDVAVNLIDTPGHPDFIAEVERVLGVLDGAVLVVSAVEGVQAQTRILMRTLRRLGIPTLVFVNKVDRRGARPDLVLRSVAEKLAVPVVPMGSVIGAGTASARYVPHAAADADHAARLADLLASHDDRFLTQYVRDESSITPTRLRRGLVALTRRSLAHPVFFGSAITGEGVDALTAGLAELLPVVDAAVRDDEAAVPAATTAPASGTVFKIERGPAGEKIAYTRLFSGTVRVRDRIRFHGSGRDGSGKVTALSVFGAGRDTAADSATAGQIAKLRGLPGIRIGDCIGDPPATATGRRHFAAPTLETVVAPRRPADKGALHAALTLLAEQDPLINLRQDELRGEISVSLYGEVQKEVIEATLAGDFGIEVTFRESTAVCVERLVGTGERAEVIAKDPNPFLATVGLRIEPGPPGSGVRFHLGIELGSLPLAFIKAVEDTVYATLRQGIHGWQVDDCVVTLVRSGYWPRQSHAHGTFDKSMSSTAGDFRNLTPLVLMAALRDAGTTVHEPIHRLLLELPADAVAAVMPVLVRLGAVAWASATRGSTCVLDGEIPADRVHALEQLLPALTGGEGALTCEFERYRQVLGPVPERSRTDHNPLDRKEYLLHVQRRV